MPGEPASTPRSDITVGIDIGTTSVKAVAVDGSGEVLARARVPHDFSSPEPDLFQHDADRSWHDNVLDAYRSVSAGLTVAAVDVAAMVPSLCAVDGSGHALTPGLLYGDRRGGTITGKNPSESGEVANYLKWCASEAPRAAAFWPAQAMANHALTGHAAIDTVTAMTTVPLFDFTGWDPVEVARAGASPGQLPTIVPGSTAVGTTPDGALVGGGTVDAFAEQLVAGADGSGDVLVILGTTLIVWVAGEDWVEVPGLWTVPHSSPGLTLVGGASNAGGLFLNWAQRLLRDDGGPQEAARSLDPRAVPVWEPYVRGERVPLHDPSRRAAIRDLDLTMGPAAARRAAFEASGFACRHIIELAGVPANRLVLTGGGVRVDEWVQAVVDCTGVVADVVAVPEGGALGAAFLARSTAGLEPDATGAGRWARTDRRVEPDVTWQAAAESRWARYRDRAGAQG